MLLLCLLLSILLSIPWVQTKIADYATTSINNDFGTDISIEKVDLSFLGTVRLKGVKIKDHHKDTLIFVDKLSTSILNVGSLGKGNFNLGSVALTDAYFYMKTYKNEEDSNLDVFVDAFENDAPKDSLNSFYLETDNIYLDNFNYKFENQNKETPIPFSASKTGGNIQNFIIDDSGIAAKLRGLYFIDNRTLEVVNLTTDFKYSDTGMIFNDFYLQTPKSRVESQITFSYNKGDLADFNNKIEIKADFAKSTLAISDLRKFYNELSGNDILNIEGKFRGKINDFSLNELDISSENGLQIIGDLNFKNAVDREKGFVFKGNLKKVTASYVRLKNILPGILGKNLPSEMQRFGDFTLTGTTRITEDNIDANLKVNSVLGRINTNLKLTNVTHIDDAIYDGKVEFINFNVGQFLRDPLFGKISFKGDINGSGFTLDNINTSIIGEFSKFEFKEYPYKNINVNGEYGNNLFDGELQIDDPNLKLEFKGLADLSSEVHEFDFRANIEYADLYKINLFKRDSIALLKGKMELDVDGNTFNDILGKAVFTDVFYTNQEKEYEFKEFIVTSSVKDSIKNIKIDSKDIVQGELEGNFNFDEIVPMSQNALGSIYTNYVPKEIPSNRFINFNFSIYNQIVEVFFPKFIIDSNTNIRGKIDADDNKFKLVISSPKIVAYEVEVKDILLRTDNQNKLYNSHLTASEINSKIYNVSKFNLLSRTKNDTLFFKSIFKGNTEKNTKTSKNEEYNVDFFYTINEDEKSVLGLEKSSLNFKDNEWIINPESDNQNKIVFDLNTNEFIFSPFKLVSNKQKIEFTGSIQDNNKKLLADFTQVELRNFLPVIDSLEVQGILNGTVDFVQKDGKYNPEGILLIENFKINEFEQGNLALTIKGNDSYEQYSVDLSLQNKDLKSLGATGVLDFSSEIPQIDLDVFMEGFQLISFSPLGGEVISRLRGKASGDFTIKGRLGNPDMEGSLRLIDAGMKFPYLNVDYDFVGESTISLNGQSFIFQDIDLQDIKYKTKGKLVGDITHRNFKYWFMNLDIAANNMLVLDTKDTEEALYFGTAFITGNASITGLTDQLTIDVNGRTEKGTLFVIPLKDVQTISNYRLIHFKSENVENEEEIALDAVKGLSLNIDLQVTKDATAEVVIDEVNGSKLRGTGSGELRIDINTRGKFEMYGDYTIDSGVYDFKYGGIINRPFMIQQGGVVSWSGDPADANLNVTAIYQTKANPAVILENFNTNRKIPVNLVISISGGLFTSKQEFQIKIPNANSNIASELEFVLNENDVNNNAKQFFSLLAFGNFSNPNKAEFNSNAVLAGTTSNLLANVLTDLISSDGGKFQLGVDYTQGSQNEVDNLNTDNQVDVSVSTQVSNRVIINGKVGVPVGTATQSSVVGEVKVEVLLTQEGNFRAVVFNRQNEIQYSTEEEGYTQGVGLSYQVDFNSLSGLLGKIGIGKDRKKKEKPITPRDTIIKSPYINTKKVIE